MKKHKLAYIFMNPVDPVELKIPDYFDIIKNPMDLTTVEGRLKRGEYPTPLEFGRDMRLITSNALTYNPKQSSVHACALTFQEYFEKNFSEVEENPANDNYSYIADQGKKYENKVEKAIAPKNPNSKPMTYEEKRSLS